MNINDVVLTIEQIAELKRDHNIDGRTDLVRDLTIRKYHRAGMKPQAILARPIARGISRTRLYQILDSSQYIGVEKKLGLIE